MTEKAFTTSESWTEKYRPKSLSDIVGQAHVVSEIRGMIKQKKVHSTILLSGKTGLGKTTIAMIIAYAINELKYGTPTSDILDFNIGAESGKEDVLNILRLASFAPSANFKVLILDEVHRLSAAAASALLKPLEKPAPNTVWILATDQPEKLLGPIVGRALKLNLHGIEPEDLVPRLQEICKEEKLSFINEKILLSIARNANAQPRSAINLLQSVNNQYHGGTKDVKVALSQALEAMGAGVDMLAAKLLSCVYGNKPKGLYNTLKLIKANEYIGISNYLLYHNQFLIEQKLEIQGWSNEVRKKLIGSIDMDKITLSRLNKTHQALVYIKKELATFMVPEFDLLLTNLLALLGNKNE